LLRARLVIGASAENKATHQYGIRQLMGLTFAIAVVLGLGRVLINEEVLRDLAMMGPDLWNLFATDTASFVL
jgi:hypothetical protein